MITITTTQMMEKYRILGEWIQSMRSITFHLRKALEDPTTFEGTNILEFYGHQVENAQRFLASYESQIPKRFRMQLEEKPIYLELAIKATQSILSEFKQIPPAVIEALKKERIHGRRDVIYDGIPYDTRKHYFIAIETRTEPLHIHDRYSQRNRRDIPDLEEGVLLLSISQAQRFFNFKERKT